MQKEMLAEMQPEGVTEVVIDLREEMMRITGAVGVMTVTDPDAMMTEARDVSDHLDGTGTLTETVVMTGREEMTTGVIVHHVRRSHVAARLLRSWMLRWMCTRKRYLTSKLSLQAFCYK